MATYFRYALNRRESGQWNHCNPEIAHWRRNRILDRVSDDAIGRGYSGWMIFDQDESWRGRGVDFDGT